MEKRQRQFGRGLKVGLVILLSVAMGTSVRAEVSVNARVTQAWADEVQVNAGTDRGLHPGLQGTLRLSDGRGFECEVLSAGRASARLRLSAVSPEVSLLNQSVELTFEVGPLALQGPNEPNEPNEPEEFVPLLAPARQTPNIARPANLSHGRIQIHQMIQNDGETGLNYSITRMSTSGTIERMQGSPWSLEWSGNLRYRDGAGYRSYRDYQDPRLYLYQAALQRPLQDGGFLRLGRFLPLELPGIGTIDGLQRESRQGDHFRIGALIGLKPRRIDLAASASEPTVVGYTTLSADGPGAGRYSGTVGLLSSLFEGKADRLALLVDQQADINADLTLYSTAALDFDIGAAQVHPGTRLTRLDVYGVSRVTSSVRLRAGVDHWERPDNEAQRDLLIVNDSLYFNNGYWRYWVGSDQSVSQHLRFSQEVAFIDSDSGDPRWRLGLTRTGLWGLSDASMTMTVFNLVGVASSGYGGRLSGYFPMMGRKLSLQPIAGFRIINPDVGSNDFMLNYLSFRLDGRLSSRWRLFGGGTYTFGDQVDAKLFEFGLRYTW